MPEGLDIDRSKKLDGTVASYSRHVLVFTGEIDWKSRIEDEHESGAWGRVLGHLKKEMGAKGEFHNVSESDCAL